MNQSQKNDNLPPTRFMLVDDDKICNTIAKFNVLKYNPEAEVQVYSDPEIALATIQQQEIPADAKTIILLDINMPLLSGWDFLDALARHGEEFCRRFTIIMLSSSLDYDELKRAKTHPLLSGFLSKPLNPKELESMLI
ncbi:response regulator [Dyadobacter sp. CY345]|uniref:response regulator n=1 Tax=Dyadobacter sp. CY345 TaxID=2909335 RepID=UPI001F327991|nr:response regulator [Dyadobacter sp. CY345]MCF2443608.1 response regulator [Dyadobacter sp. CY345]